MKKMNQLEEENEKLKKINQLMREREKEVCKKIEKLLNKLE